MVCANSFIAGNIVVIQARFSDSLQIIVTPSSVEISLKDSKGVEITAPMQNVDGLWRYEFDTTGKVGNFTYKVKSSGTYQAVSVGSFAVVPA